MMRLKRALSEFVIDGIETTIPLFNDLIRQPDIANGLYDIHWLEKYLAKPASALASISAHIAVAKMLPSRYVADALFENSAGSIKPLNLIAYIASRIDLPGSR